MLLYFGLPQPYHGRCTSSSPTLSARSKPQRAGGPPSSSTTRAFAHPRRARL